MAEPFYVISYSHVDGEDAALRLGDQLAAGPPSIPVWLDQRNLQPGIDRYSQIVESLKSCQGVLFVMTRDSVESNCPCTQEWIRALKYKKPVIPLVFHSQAELPFRLEPREAIAFTDFSTGIARLRAHIRWRATPAGMLHTVQERLTDALRDLRDAAAAEKVRIEDEIAVLRQQISSVRITIEDPRAAQERTNASIARGLERERQPEVRVTSSKVETRFINRLPMIPPAYFQDRHVETGLIGSFVRNDTGRLMTVVGRGGVGKTAMVCRLLRALEVGKLPDDGGDLHVDGIVYLSARAGHPVNFPNLFYDVCRLLPEETAKSLDLIYRDPQQTTETTTQALLAAFPSGRTVVLLDNFEDVIDAATQTIKERELSDALRTVLEAPPHGLKFIITTRVAPQAILRIQPGLQESLELDQGLKSPYAENVLKAMDPTGTLGLAAPDAPLAEAREATRGFPRALEALVGILRTDRSTDLRALLRELRQLSSKVDDVVRDLVGEAYNRLDPPAQLVMQALAIYGAPVPAVAVDYLLQPHQIGIDSAKVLARLVNMQFVRGEAGRYYLHQVDRDYALSRVPRGSVADRSIEPPPLTLYALRQRAAQYFKETRKPREAWKTLDDLASQLAEFDLRLLAEDHVDAALVLLEIDGDYLSLWGHYRLMTDRYARLHDKLPTPDLQTMVGLRLANAYARLGQLDDAIGFAEKAVDSARSQQNQEDEANTLLTLGWLYNDSGRHNEAMSLLEVALAMFQSLSNKGGEAITRGNLANSFDSLGQSRLAIAEYEQAIALHRETGNVEAECRDSYNLADAYENLGEYERSRRLAETSRTMARQIGYRMLDAATTNLLASLLIDEGRLQDAIKTYEEASRIADDANAVQIQHSARLGLACAYLYDGDLRRANLLVQAGLQHNWLTGRTGALALAGVIAARLGDRGAAIAAFDGAVAEADGHLRGAAKPRRIAYSRALALAGLAVSRDPALADAAAAAYRDARAINTDPGIVSGNLRDLDALIAVDDRGILRPVRAALAGEFSGSPAGI